MPRFFVEEIGPEERVVIRGSESLHIQRVLRMKRGDRLTLFDGEGREFGAVIEEVGGDKVIVGGLKQLDLQKESPLSITIAQGIPKAKKMDLIIGKATELGVSGIIPVITERSISLISAGGADKKRERWQRIALEAAKQCGRTVIPEVKGVLPVNELLELDSLPERRLLLWEEEGERDIKAYLNSTPKGDIVCLIGPEGGLSAREAGAAREKGFVPVSLGRRILRTETASLALLSIIQYEWGDLGFTQK